MARRGLVYIDVLCPDSWDESWLLYSDFVCCTQLQALVYWINSRAQVSPSCMRHRPYIHVVHVPCTLDIIIIDNNDYLVMTAGSHICYTLCVLGMCSDLVFLTGFLTSTCLPLKTLTKQISKVKLKHSIHYRSAIICSQFGCWRLTQSVDVSSWKCTRINIALKFMGASIETLAETK